MNNQSNSPLNNDHHTGSSVDRITPSSPSCDERRFLLDNFPMTVNTVTDEWHAINENPDDQQFGDKQAGVVKALELAILAIEKEIADRKEVVSLQEIVLYKKKALLSSLKAGWIK